MAIEYHELRKLYYKNKNQYEEEYRKRLESSSAVSLGFDIGGSPAFFLQDPVVTSRMYSILRLDKRIALLCGELPGIALQQYSRRCLIDEIVLSNNIEGVHSSRKEIGQALVQLDEQTQKKGKYRRFQGLVNEYDKLVSQTVVPLATCQDIRKLYDEIVLEEVLEEDERNAPDGEIFRKEQTTVRSATDKVIHTGMTPESKIIEAMDRALIFLNDEAMEPLFRIILFHYLFEYIHPFYDGNGRTGRFILSYGVSRSLTPLLAYRISGTIRENLNDYYKAFVMCNDPLNRGDITPFVIIMLGMIEASAEELIDSLEQKLHDWERCCEIAKNRLEIITEDRINFYSLLIQASLFSELGITAKELEMLMRISHSTLKNRFLDEARQNGSLVEKKIRNIKHYSLNMEIFDT